MSNHTTGAQRRNARMEKIFDRAKKEGRDLSGNSNHKTKALEKAKISKRSLEKGL